MKNMDVGELTEETGEGFLCQVEELGLYWVGQRFLSISAYWNPMRKF